jgi:hypothetical protein
MRDTSSDPASEFEHVQSSELIHLGPLEPPQSSELIHLGPLEPPTSTYTMSQTMENLERISLGLPVTDASGNYFPPTPRSDSEKELLRELRNTKHELSRAYDHAHYLERQVLYAQIEASCERANARLASYRERPGLFSGLISTLTLGVF